MHISTKVKKINVGGDIYSRLNKHGISRLAAEHKNWNISRCWLAGVRCGILIIIVLFHLSMKCGWMLRKHYVLEGRAAVVGRSPEAKLLTRDSENGGS